MKKLIVCMFALAAAAVAVPASAQWYLGLGVGAADTTNGDTSGIAPPAGVAFTTTGFDSWKTSGQVYGGYQFTPIWGVELQYTYLGSRSGAVTFGAPINGTAPTSSFSSYQVGIAVTGTYAFNEQWFGRAKLGVSSNHTGDFAGTVTTGGGTGTIVVTSGSKTDVLAGAGIGYNFSKEVTGRIEYEYFGKFIDTLGISPKGQNVGAKLQYNF